MLGSSRFAPGQGRSLRSFCCSTVRFFRVFAWRWSCHQRASLASLAFPGCRRVGSLSLLLRNAANSVYWRIQGWGGVPVRSGMRFSSWSVRVRGSALFAARVRWSWTHLWSLRSPGVLFWGAGRRPVCAMKSFKSRKRRCHRSSRASLEGSISTVLPGSWRFVGGRCA